MCDLSSVKVSGGGWVVLFICISPLVTIIVGLSIKATEIYPSVFILCSSNVPGIVSISIIVVRSY